MDEFGRPRFDGIVNPIRKKRSQTSRRPRPESQPLPESRDRSLLSSTPTPPSDDVSKVSSDENTGCDGNSKRKMFNLNQCASRGFSTTTSEADYPTQQIKNEDGESNVFGSYGGLGDGVGNENKLKKLKLKVGGFTRTIQTKSSTHGASGSGSSTKIARSSDAPRPRPKLILQGDSDEDHSPTPDKKSGFQGIPWKDFSRCVFSLGKEYSSMGKMSGNNASEKQGEKSDPVRKSKRVPKRRILDRAFEEDDEDDEIRYLEKLKTSKIALGFKDFEEESSKKQRSLSRVSKGGKSENLEEFGPVRSVKDGKKSRSEIVTEDADYEDEEELLSDGEPEGKRKDPSDSPTESKREMTLTTRQRALLSSKDACSASGASQVEFPNGLPPPPPRRQKEKLSEVEQQLKKVEAAQRRRMQSEKASRELEAEAIRKILGQDSSRKKREDKMKQRREELAQEKAANAQILASSTIRWVMGPNGTTVMFSKEMGLPKFFDHKPISYPPPREKCAGPCCINPYKYRDSKSNLPLCSLQCYKAIHEKMETETCS